MRIPAIINSFAGPRVSCGTTDSNRTDSTRFYVCKWVLLLLACVSTLPVTVIEFDVFSRDRSPGLYLGLWTVKLILRETHTLSHIVIGYWSLRFGFRVQMWTSVQTSFLLTDASWICLSFNIMMLFGWRVRGLDQILSSIGPYPKDTLKRINNETMSVSHFEDNWLRVIINIPK